MALIEPNMKWPPDRGLAGAKLTEHLAWYSGVPEMLVDYYSTSNQFEQALQTNIVTTRANRNTFWARQGRKTTDFFVHVPIASDIAETSSSFLFSESPVIRINSWQNAQKTGTLSDSASSANKEGQELLDNMLIKTGFYNKILEGAEIASAVGGVFARIVWDAEICDYPMIEFKNPDNVYARFKFGILVEANFVSEIGKSDSGKHIRLVETYTRQGIENHLYEGSDGNIGNEITLSSIDATKGLLPKQDTWGQMMAFYIPNMLPNRIDTDSPMGRSDILGLETLMDSLDEVFSDWMWDIQVAKGRILAPEDWLDTDDHGTDRFDIDQAVYKKLDIDTNVDGKTIQAIQFGIRADEYEKTCLNLLDRIITSAGYSPQSFGLNIQGRAESGTALDIRERKSFSTSGKKESYWENPLISMVTAMITVYNNVFNGGINCEIDPTVAFIDAVSNNLPSLANSVKLISDASAASTETKVRMLHPEWTETEVQEEVQKIQDESKVSIPDGFGNPDIDQIMDDDKTYPEGSEEVDDNEDITE